MERWKSRKNRKTSNFPFLLFYQILLLLGDLIMLIVLRVDVGEFYKNVGDKVEKNEKIGMLRSIPVILMSIE